jgi:hypothetical protein
MAVARDVKAAAVRSVTRAIRMPIKGSPTWQHQAADLKKLKRPKRK